MSDKKKERFRNGPQAEQENKFKGKFVSIASPTTLVIGKLAWVDVYTYGVQETPEADEPTIVFKGPGVVVKLIGIPYEWM